MTGSPAGLNCRNRVIEWICTGILLGYSVNVVIWPNTIADGNFRYLTAIGVGPIIFFWSCFIVGVLRCVALYFNGRGLPWSARTRALCAIFGAVVFGHLALMLAYIVKDGNPMPLGFWTHGMLALGEMYSCLRAGADVSEIYNQRSRPSVYARIVATDDTGDTAELNIVDAVTRPSSQSHDT